MPNIPTYLPELPLGQAGSGRPNLVDVPSGRGVSAANYINAIDLPNISNETFMGDVRASQAMAGAVQEVSGMIGHLAKKEIEAKNYADVAIAEDKMRTRFAEWENNKPMGSPETWATSWKAESDAAIKEIMSDRSLSQSAKEELSLRLGRFATDAHINVARDSTKAQFMRAASANQAQYIRYMDQGNYEAAKSTMEEGVKNGWRYEDDLARVEVDISQRKKAEEFDSLMLDIDRDPDAAEKAYQSKRESLSFEQQRQAERAIKAAKNQRTYFDGEQEAQVATESLAMLSPDKLKTATIDDLGVKWDKASAYQKFTVQKRLELAQGKAKMNDPVEFEQAITAAMNYLPEEDPTQIKGAQFEARAEAMFDGPMLSRIKDALKKANDGQMGDDTLLASVRKDVMHAATQPTMVEVPKTEMVNGQMMPVLKDAQKIGTTPASTIEKRGLFGWDWTAFDEEIPAKDIYEGGQAVDSGTTEKPKVSEMVKQSLPPPKENLIKAKRVTDELERQWKNPATRKKFIEDPREFEILRDSLLRKEGLPVVPGAPAAAPSLFPTGSYEDALKATK